MFRFGHVELFVQDPERSLAFYRDVLGFEQVAIQDGGFTWLRHGDLEVLLRPGTGRETPRYRDAACGFVLYANDLPATLRALEARGLVLKGDDGAGCPTFADPDGHWFQLVNPRQHGG